jgi:hypothetical protein
MSSTIKYFMYPELFESKNLRAFSTDMAPTALQAIEGHAFILHFGSSFQSVATLDSQSDIADRVWSNHA